MSNASDVSNKKKWRKWRWICLLPCLVCALTLPSDTSFFVQEAYAALTNPFGNTSSFGTESEPEENNETAVLPAEDEFTLPPNDEPEDTQTGEETELALNTPSEENQGQSGPSSGGAGGNSGSSGSNGGNSGGQSGGSGPKKTAFSFPGGAGGSGGGGYSDNGGSNPDDNGTPSDSTPDEDDNNNGENSCANSDSNGGNSESNATGNDSDANNNENSGTNGGNSDGTTPPNANPACNNNENNGTPSNGTPDDETNGPGGSIIRDDIDLPEDDELGGNIPDDVGGNDSDGITNLDDALDPDPQDFPPGGDDPYDGPHDNGSPNGPGNGPSDPYQPIPDSDPPSDGRDTTPQETTSVPEPGTLALFGSALLLLRRKRRGNR